MRQPDSYTVSEGGKLKAWPESLDINAIGLDHYIKGRYVKVGKGIVATPYKMHAIIWNAVNCVDLGGRWDSVNHWTQPLKDLHPTHQFLHRKPLAEVSDGSTANYYELPSKAKQLQDLISHTDMNAQIGEIFRACYRYGRVEHSGRLRDSKNIKFYIDAEIKRLEKLA